MCLRNVLIDPHKNKINNQKYNLYKKITFIVFIYEP